MTYVIGEPCVDVLDRACEMISTGAARSQADAAARTGPVEASPGHPAGAWRCALNFSYKY